MSVSLNNGPSNNKTAEDIEKEMQECIQRFTALMEALRTLNTLSPPGFREYFEYGMGIFRESKRLEKITEEYTGRLKAAADEAVKESGKVYEGGPTVSVGKLIVNNPNGLDTFEKIRRLPVAGGSLR